jgi:hypothetical protein
MSDIVVITGHGKVHKAVLDWRGRVVGHPRCRLRDDARILGNSTAAYDYDLLQHPAMYCRYRWCFRDLLVEMGVDPSTGHVQRYIRRKAIRQVIG